MVKTKTIDFIERRGPWGVIERRKAYQNKFGLAVLEDKVLRPDGKEGIYGWVKIGDGVNILPMDDENNVYLAKGFMYPINKESIEVSSGGIDEGETPLKAAERELKEELGIKYKTLIDAGMLRPITGKIYTNQYLYIVRGLEFGEKTDYFEDLKLTKMPLTDAVNKVMSGEIDDWTTVVLILKANELLRRS